MKRETEEAKKQRLIQQLGSAQAISGGTHRLCVCGVCCAARNELFRMWLKDRPKESGPSTDTKEKPE